MQIHGHVILQKIAILNGIEAQLYNVNPDIKKIMKQMAKLRNLTFPVIYLHSPYFISDELHC